MTHISRKTGTDIQCEGPMRDGENTVIDRRHLITPVYINAFNILQVSDKIISFSVNVKNDVT